MSTWKEISQRLEWREVIAVDLDGAVKRVANIGKEFLSGTAEIIRVSFEPYCKVVAALYGETLLLAFGESDHMHATILEAAEKQSDAKDYGNQKWVGGATIGVSFFNEEKARTEGQLPISIWDESHRYGPLTLWVEQVAYQEYFKLLEGYGFTQAVIDSEENERLLDRIQKAEAES